jgi:hypothetical protein
MKSVTEFPNFKLAQGLSAKTALAAEGKSPEEIQTSIGEKFKLEGDKLKYFINAIEVAGQNMEKLTRVLVVSFVEGEKLPPKATKLEELHYVPEFQAEPKKKEEVKDAKAGGRGGPGGGKGRGGPGGKGGGKPKESPWGISPEEKAAKKAASIRTQQEKAAAGKKA